MHHRPLLPTLLLTLLLCAPLPLPAQQVYRSIGPDGEVIFSDTRTPGAVPVTISAPAADPAAARERRARSADEQRQAEAMAAARTARDDARSAARREAAARQPAPPPVVVVEVDRGGGTAVPVLVDPWGVPYGVHPGAVYRQPPRTSDAFVRRDPLPQGPGRWHGGRPGHGPRGPQGEPEMTEWPRSPFDSPPFGPPAFGPNPVNQAPAEP